MCCEIIWIRYLLDDLKVCNFRVTDLYCDNKAVIHIAANPVFYKRTKYIEIDYYLIRDKVQEGSIVTRHVNSKQQIADIFTKPLSNWLFKEYMIKMRVENI